MVAQIHRKFPVLYGTSKVVAVFKPPLDPTSNTVYTPATMASRVHKLKIT